MIKYSISQTGVENLDTHSRAVRALVGAGLIVFVMTTPEAPLGWYTILPLLAVYPIFSSITGWDPVKAFFRHPNISRRALHFSGLLRVVAGVLGVSLIGSVYVASYLGTSLGVFAVLPILGIYPVFAAIAGMDPVTALYNLDHSWDEAETSSQTSQAFSIIDGRKPLASEHEEQQHSKAA